MRERQQDMFIPVAPRPLDADLEAREAGPTTAPPPSDRAVANAILRLRGDDNSLVAYLREQVPAWQRATSRIVLARQLGGAHATKLFAIAFRPDPAPPPAAPAPEPTSAQQFAAAHATALAELALGLHRAGLSPDTVADTMAEAPRHIVAATLGALKSDSSLAPSERNALRGHAVELTTGTWTSRIRNFGQPDRLTESRLARAQAIAPAAHARAATLYREARAHATDATANSPEVDEALTRAGSGMALPEAVRRDMERLFGVDLARVRIHTGSMADRAATAVQAVAFTVGEEIFFSIGAFDPTSDSGRKLLVHELTHVVQAYQGRVPTRGGTGMRVSQPGDALEREAEAKARGAGGDLQGAGSTIKAQAPTGVTTQQPSSSMVRASAPLIQREAASPTSAEAAPAALDVAKDPKLMALLHALYKTTLSSEERAKLNLEFVKLAQTTHNPAAAFPLVEGIHYTGLESELAVKNRVTGGAMPPETQNFANLVNSESGAAVRKALATGDNQDLVKTGIVCNQASHLLGTAAYDEGKARGLNSTTEDWAYFKQQSALSDDFASSSQGDTISATASDNPHGQASVARAPGASLVTFRAVCG